MVGDGTTIARPRTTLPECPGRDRRQTQAIRRLVTFGCDEIHQGRITYRQDECGSARHFRFASRID